MDIPEIRNEQLERAVLGTALRSKEGACAVAGLDPRLFTSTKHRQGLSAIQTLVQRGASVDFTTMPVALTEHGCFDQTGDRGAEFFSTDELVHMADHAPHEKQLRHHVGTLERLQEQRDLLMFGKTVVRETSEKILNREELAEAQANAQSAVVKMACGNGGSRVPELIGPIAQRLFREMQDRVAGKETRDAAIATGVPSLDRALDGGLRAGQLIVLCGRTTHGKTSLSLGMALHIARTAPALFFSLEMSREQLAARVFARNANVPMRCLRTGLLSDASWASLTEALGDIDELGLVIDDTPSVTTAGVMTRTQAVNIRQQRPVKAIFIDYLGLMETEERYQSEVLKIGAITRGLKLIAKQLSVPIVLLCQLNRNLESRDDKTPRLSDLRDSGAIEQDSDVVISVCRPWLYVPTPDNERECRLSILKHRDGIVGDLALEWHPETASFRDPS